MKLNRRTLLRFGSLFGGLLCIPKVSQATISAGSVPTPEPVATPEPSVTAEDNPHTYMKIWWKELTTEQLKPGDFWASYDPNQPELQGQNNYNLQMQAIHPTNYGKPTNSVPLGRGGHWRPAGFVTVSWIKHPPGKYLDTIGEANGFEPKD